jgi:hypothetical protein
MRYALICLSLFTLAAAPAPACGGKFVIRAVMSW